MASVFFFSCKDEKKRVKYNCNFPHEPKNYDVIMQFLKNKE